MAVQDAFPASRMELHVEWFVPLPMKKMAPMAPTSTPNITQVDRQTFIFRTFH